MMYMNAAWFKNDGDDLGFWSVYLPGYKIIGVMNSRMSCVHLFTSSEFLLCYRWAMFGFAVGMLTEYATGSDFVDQVKILLSNFGIVDLE